MAQLQKLQTTSKLKNYNIFLQKKTGPIIWAVDMPRMKAEAFQKISKALELWNPDQREVIPVSIVAPFDLGWILPMSLSSKRKSVSEAQNRMRLQLSKLNVEAQKGVVLPAGSNSLRQRVVDLIKFARKKKASFILAGSGAQSTSNIIGLGSFAETLISLSPVPVLIVGENVEVFEPVSRILFPTDFSPASKGIFKSVVEFAKTSKAEVLIYHHLDLAMGPMLYGVPGGMEGQVLENFWRSQEESRRLEAKALISWAQKQKVKCDFVCDQSAGALHSRVMDVARSHSINLITLGVHRGPWGQVILGHNVRGLFVGSHCPVLVLHSPQKKKN